MTKKGVLYSWGYGKDGQLGVGDFRDANLPVQIEKASQVGSFFPPSPSPINPQIA